MLQQWITQSHSTDHPDRKDTARLHIKHISLQTPLWSVLMSHNKSSNWILWTLTHTHTWFFLAFRHWLISKDGSAQGDKIRKNIIYPTIKPIRRKHNLSMSSGSSASNQYKCKSAWPCGFQEMFCALSKCLGLNLNIRNVLMCFRCTSVAKQKILDAYVPCSIIIDALVNGHMFI